MNKEQLKKIKALAERGVGGEAEAAKRILARLLDENDIDASELQETQEFSWGWKDYYEEKLLLQVIAKYGDRKHMYTRAQKKRLYNECTQAQADMITVAYNIYRKDFNAHMKIAQDAFIHANSIYPSEKDTRSENDFTEEELEEMRKVWRMARGVDRSVLPAAQIGERQQIEEEDDNE